MKVRLISHTNIPENLVSVAARLCYSEGDIDSVAKKVTPEIAEKFVENLLSFGHESPIEHVSFTFAIEGVSRALLAQITRHRIASFSVQSQRYVKENNFSFIIPPEIEKNKEAKDLFLNFMKQSKECYCRLMDLISQNKEKELKDDGISIEKAKKKAVKESAQDARFVLPNACATKFILTMNARSLLNFFRLRCCNRAQWEINNLACEMLKLVSKVAPAIFKNAGPSCVSGFCKEGKMSCQKAEEVREKFKKIKSGEL